MMQLPLQFNSHRGGSWKLRDDFVKLSGHLDGGVSSAKCRQPSIRMHLEGLFRLAWAVMGGVLLVSKHWQPSVQMYTDEFTSLGDGAFMVGVSAQEAGVSKPSEWFRESVGALQYF